MNGLEIKKVPFMGTELMAARDNDGQIWAGASYICNGIGLSKSQKDTQIEKIQTEKVLKRGCRKFPAGVFDPNNITVAVKLDFVPLWLAKISITPTMEAETPELAEILMEYQLKAKDVLAAAFLPTAANPEPRPDRDAYVDACQLKVFEHPVMGSIRAVVIGGEPWFVGKDVVLAIGYKSTKGILDGHILQRNLMRTNPQSMRVSTRALLDKCGPHILDLLEQMWFPTLVNVPGLFNLIHSCKKLRIRDFEEWLREGILPALQVELPESERPALPAPAPRPGKKEPPADPAQGNRLIGSICCMLANADLPTLNSVFRFLSESQT